MKNLVVCIDDHWIQHVTGLPPCYPSPKAGEIYTIHSVVDEGYLELKEFLTPNQFFVIPSWNPKKFRPVDDTFGEVVAEIIEKQLELETA